MISPQSGNTAKWLTLLTDPNPQVTAHVNVMRSGMVLADYPIETAKVTLDRTAAVRRTCTLTVAPQVGSGTTLDMSWMDLFAAAGNEVRPWFQVTFSDGTTDEVCLGTFTIVTTKWTFSGTDVTATVSGSDRSYILSEAEALVPQTLSGVTVDQAIEQFISSHNFGVPINYNIVPTSDLVPATGAIVKPGKTAWSQVTDLAASAGYEVFFDNLGTLVGRPIPNPSASAQVLSVDTVSRSGLVTVTSTSTRKKIYSVFGVVGAGTIEVTSPTTGNLIHKKVAIYGQAADENPGSPTYANGAFGSIGKLTRSGIVSTQAMANSMSAGLLAQQVGAMTALDVEILPMPLLDCWDVVGVSVPMLGVAGAYVVDGWDLTVHFTGTQTLTVRQVFS